MIRSTTCASTCYQRSSQRIPSANTPVAAQQYTHRKAPVKTRYNYREAAKLTGWMQTGFVNSIRFHLSGFTPSWTLSSKFFATFPHGTCLLSVSWSYLALDEVYHPLWAAISGNPTPKCNIPTILSPVQVWHLLWTVAPLKGTLGAQNRRIVTPIRYNS